MNEIILLHYCRLFKHNINDVLREIETENPDKILLIPLQLGNKYPLEI